MIVITGLKQIYLCVHKKHSRSDRNRRRCLGAAGVKILKGSKIRNGAVISAASVVKGEIPQNAIAVGAIAKVKKYRQ